MTDEELRERLTAWVRPIESAPAPAIEGISLRARRRVRRLAAAVSAVAVACVTLAVVLPGIAFGHGRPATATGWRPSGSLPGQSVGPASAPYFVMLDLQLDPSSAVVYRVSAAQPLPRRIATVSPPRGVTLTDITAAADDRTFLLTGNYVRGPTLLTRYYELRLSAGGRPGRLIPLRLRLPARPEGGLGVAALSPDGSKLAVVGQVRHGLSVGVVVLATGAVRVWSAPGPTTQLLMVSWQNDRKLMALWTPPGSGKPQIRVLDTATVGGSLMQRSRPLVPARVRFGRYRGLSRAPITAAGHAVFALMSMPPRAPYGPGRSLAVVEFSARTGRPERLITQSTEIGMGSLCGVLWADQSGRQVVTSCVNHFGTSRGGHYTSWSERSFWTSLQYVPFAW